MDQMKGVGSLGIRKDEFKARNGMLKVERVI
jgi:hypothetical protein